MGIRVRVVRDMVETFGGRQFRLVTRIDPTSPPEANVSTAHCLAFQGDSIVLALHASRDWTIPGGHLEEGESPTEALAREASEEAGITIAEPVLLGHEQIDPLDGVAADPRYPVPAFQLFYVARLVRWGAITAVEECSEARLFSPEEARLAPGWIQRNLDLYEAGLELATATFARG